MASFLRNDAVLPPVAFLLQPVSDAAPCGEDLSFSSEFDAIREARRGDDPTLEQGEWQTDIKAADWNRVAELCIDLLRTRTKDLRVAAWLAEALARRDGLPGLAHGLACVHGLAERYWENLHPRGESSDDEERLGNLAWMIGRLAQLAREAPLVQSADARHSLADLEAAQALQARIDRDPEVPAAGRLTLARFNAVGGRTPPAFFVHQREALEGARRCIQGLDGFLDERHGIDAPSFSRLAKSLEDYGAALDKLVGGGGVAAAAPAAPAPPSAGRPAAVLAAGPIAGRAAALAQLREIAEFFRRTEPHSPVAYLADKAAQWGEMPLHAWLREVVKDGGAMAHLEELLGLARARSEGE